MHLKAQSACLRSIFGDHVVMVKATGGRDRKDLTCGRPERQRWAFGPQLLTIGY